MKEVDFSDIKHLYPDHLKKDYIIFRRDEWDKAETVYHIKNEHKSTGEWFQYPTPKGILLAHQKAKLVCIEEINPCEHEKVDYKMYYTEDEAGNTNSVHRYKCLQCGEPLKPKNGWEVCDERTNI